MIRTSNVQPPAIASIFTSVLSCQAEAVSPLVVYASSIVLLPASTLSKGTDITLELLSLLVGTGVVVLCTHSTNNQQLRLCI